MTETVLKMCLGEGKSNLKSLEGERGSYFKQKSGADCVRALQQPPSPFQTGTFKHVVRILGEISATNALSGEMSAPFASSLKYFLRLCDQLVEGGGSDAEKKAPPNLPQNVVTFRPL